MTSTTESSYDRGKVALKGLSVDDQLAFLWFVYEKVGGSVTPAAPGAAGTDIAQGLFNQVKELSHDEQLEVQRDIASKKDTRFSRQYGSLSPETKLAFWYLLAQGMESGTIIPMPPNYELPPEGQNVLSELESLDFGRQIDFLRGAVLEMGAEAAGGSDI